MTQTPESIARSADVPVGAGGGVTVGPRDCPSPHGLGNKLGRVLWGAVWLLLFRPSPRICHSWRRMLLRLLGARIGRGCKTDPSTRIWAPWNLTMGDYAALGYDVDCYCVAPIRLGAHSTVSQYSFLCAASHDIDDPHMRLISAPIEIADQAWVCAGVFVAPGVTVGQGAVAGARAVVVSNVEPWTVVAGNPARQIKLRSIGPATT
jgi:putative colanic acid biosynthesis acetyltransferase WcaF